MDESTYSEIEVTESLFICGECNKSCDSKLQIFENDYCGHRLCEMCRFLQETKCKSCLKKAEESLVKLDNSVEEDSKIALLNFRKKRNSLKSYQHLIPVAGASGKYICSVCDREVKQQSISYHYACADDKKPLSCDQCEKTFVKKSHLECHRLSHLGIKPFKCTQCPKAFMQKDKLKRHEQTHSDLRSFVCGTCSKSFKINEDFKKHLLTHLDTRKYKCDICPRSYKHRKNLINHKLKHTDTKNFICETCGKRYALSWQLMAHRKRHQSKKHFKCVTCGNKFYTLQNLKRHSITHSEISDFECSICNTEFKRKDNLERHMKNLHEIPMGSKQQQAYLLQSSECVKTGGNTAEKKQNNSAQEKSVIVTPENMKPKSCAVSVIVKHQPTKTVSDDRETPKLLPYRILPPDKRFLQMNEAKTCVPTIMNLKAMHIVRTTDTGESNIQTIVTTDDKTNQIGDIQTKMYAIDAQAEFCKKVSQGKDDKMNKCFRIINHTDSILANKMKDNLAPKKNLKFRKSSLYQSEDNATQSTSMRDSVVQATDEALSNKFINLTPVTQQNFPNS